jgi:hypothetical protein
MNIQRLSATASNGVAKNGPIQRKAELEKKPAGETEVGEASDPSKRLLAFAEKLDQRIANAAESNKLSQRQLNALNGASAQFHALMNRIGNADFGAEGPAPYFLEALDALSKKIAGIVGAGAGQPTEDTAAAAALAKKSPAGEIDTLA